MIRFYLGEDPVLPNVPTYVGANPGAREVILERIDELVVKAVDQSGGYGMLIGPAATPAERDKFRRRVTAQPRNYVAQPTSRSPATRRSSAAGSTAPTSTCAPSSSPAPTACGSSRAASRAPRSARARSS